MTQGQQMQEDFARVFQAAPEGCFFAPGRVNLLGEHTDYNGGWVLPMALSRGTRLLFRKTAEPVITIYSADLNAREELPLAELHSFKARGSWSDYIFGACAKLATSGLQLRGLRLFITGDLPREAGLSSSASLVCVTLIALNDLHGAGHSGLTLAKMVQAVELEFAGVHCGLMDPLAILMAQEGHALAIDCGVPRWNLVPLDLGAHQIVVVDSGVPRKLAASPYNTRRQECEEALEELRRGLGVASLSELAPQQCERALDLLTRDALRRRVRHVIYENQRVRDGIRALESGEFCDFGKLMLASHYSLKEDYEVTGSVLDTLVELAMEARGVLGARMTGAGFGGCAIALVHHKKIDEFICELGPRYQRRTGYAPSFYLVEPGRGAEPIPLT